MIPSNFNYHKATSIDEVLSSLAKDPDAKILAGGHSLIPALKLRLNNPTTLIDISGIAELNGISETSGKITIGAMATHKSLAHSDVLKSKLPIFVQTAELIGDRQVRNMGTIGGSVAHADPAADYPATLLATNATIIVQGSSGTRSIPAQSFFTGFFSTALEEGELITAIEIPVSSHGQSYQKFMQPASRYAIVGCAAIIGIEGNNISSAQIALTGVTDTPYRCSEVETALIGKPVNVTSISEAVNHAVKGDVMSDHFASVPYRSHLAKVYTKRAIMAACGV